MPTDTKGCAEHGRGRTLVHALRQELIQQLQALGFMPSAYSCESATLSRQPHRDFRVSADAVAVSNDLHSCSCPQAILKVRPPNSLDYKVRYDPQAKIYSMKFLCFKKENKSIFVGFTSDWNYVAHSGPRDLTFFFQSHPLFVALFF